MQSSFQCEVSKSKEKFCYSKTLVNISHLHWLIHCPFTAVQKLLKLFPKSRYKRIKGTVSRDFLHLVFYESVPKRKKCIYKLTLHPKGVQTK
jgi:hypothetical protein